MSKKFFIIFSFAVFTFLPLQADVLRCRSGIIIGAELTMANVNIASLSTLGFPQMPVNRCYAIISIKPDDLRSFSIFDYTLQVAGLEFPCVAIWRNGKFEYFTDSVEASAPQQLLFIIDSKVISDNKSIDITLKSKLNDPDGKWDIVVPFTVIGNKPPTAISRIPARGILELSEE